MSEQLPVLATEIGKLAYEWSEIIYYPGEPEPIAGDRVLLRERYHLACARYEQTMGKDEIVILLKKAREEEQQKRTAFESRLPPSLVEGDIAKILEEIQEEKEITTKLKEAIETRTQTERMVREQEQALAENGRAILSAEQTYAPYAREHLIANEAIFEHEQDYLKNAQEREAAALEHANEAEQAEKQANEIQKQIEGRSASIFRMESSQGRLTTIEKHSRFLCQEAQAKQQQVLESEPVASLSEEHIESEIYALQQAFEEEQALKRSLDAQCTQVTQHIRIELQRTYKEHPSMAVVHFLLEKTEQDFERECHQLSEDYSVRKQEIEATLNEVEDHRNLILTHLTTLADSGVKLLKSAERYSRIPADLRRFERRPFLRLKFKEPTSEARRAKLADLLDEFIAAKTIPSGNNLLQQTVKRLISPVSVETLFLNPQTPSYVPITQMAKESGGERLTATVLLFCILVRLRSMERTHHPEASSCLILDNPIGAASLPLFIELQREVAKAMKIQLIYTTGLNDWEALRMIPHLVRLRNDAIEQDTGNHVITQETNQSGLQEMQIHMPQPEIIAEKERPEGEVEQDKNKEKNKNKGNETNG